MPIIAALLLAWLIGSVLLVILRRGRPWALIVGTQMVWLCAVIVGSLVLFVLGLGCFHCSTAQIWIVVAIALAVLLGIGIGGTAILRRLARSRS
jgi:hypothetical protein